MSKYGKTRRNVKFISNGYLRFSKYAMIRVDIG